MFRPTVQIHVLLVTWLANACFAVSAEPPSEPSRVKPPRITLIGATQANSSRQFFSLTLEVANPNYASLTYTGYAPDSLCPSVKGV